MKKIFAIMFLVALLAFLTGCGETINGMCKDTNRIGTGVRKIFVRDA